MHILPKTLQDLQFKTVVETIAEGCVTDLGKEFVLQLVPFKEKEALWVNLQHTTEFLSSYENGNAFPSHGFDSVNQELRFLGLENSVLELSGFRRIASLTEKSIALLLFLQKNVEYYPVLSEYGQSFAVKKEILVYIHAIIDKFGEVKDDASPELHRIRKALKGITGKINQSFTAALSTYNGLGYLDEIKEILQSDGVHRILIDNFNYEDTRKAVALIGNQCQTESSGNIDETTIRLYAECGVNYISSGALTHSVANMDLSLKAF